MAKLTTAQRKRLPKKKLKGTAQERFVLSRTPRGAAKKKKKKR